MGPAPRIGTIQGSYRVSISGSGLRVVLGV